MPEPSGGSAFGHFVIAGAQRSGTTYVYRMLDEHPEIEMAKPMRPEPKFFLDDAAYARGLASYEHEYFSGKPGARVRGEKSTSYLEHPVTASRIVTMLPGARVLVVVRDPVERAVSNYRFTCEHGFETLPVDEALSNAAAWDRPYDRERFSVSPYDYVRRGRYIDYLEQYLLYVAREQLIIVVLEELLAGGTEAEATLYAQLGVDATFRRSEPARRPVNASAGDAQPGAETRSFLRAYYRDANARLERLLGSPLRLWQ